jgi:hypothetical protein
MRIAGVMNGGINRGEGGGGLILLFSFFFLRLLLLSSARVTSGTGGQDDKGSEGQNVPEGAVGSRGMEVGGEEKVW